jgi:hypothetical protein
MRPPSLESDLRVAVHRFRAAPRRPRLDVAVTVMQSARKD